MTELVDREERPEHTFGVVTPEGFAVAYVSQPAEQPARGHPAGLPGRLGEGPCPSSAGRQQRRCRGRGWQGGGFARIDYVHGVDVVERLGSQPGHIGFYLPPISKNDFFKTVIVDGVLPRKTFSMGEAKEKRFYMEARRIV